MEVTFLRNYKEFIKGETSEINDTEELSYLVNTGTIADITEEKEEEIEPVLPESEEIEEEIQSALVESKEKEEEGTTEVKPKSKKGKK
ncbi:hypothetical protein AAA294_02125 [Fusobacterium varium]|uniref:hypothetical protein n=1 Tax=Fusobacterium varium TaxID=856 RepID=UPI0032C02FBD